MPQYIDRKGTDCAKWDGLDKTFGEKELLPFWVADMDFRVDIHIEEALADYLNTGAYGYYAVPDSYYDAFMEWEKSEHGLTVEREWIRFTPGVVSGFHFAVQILTEPGDAVIVTTPVYYPFMHAVENNGRKLICSELINRDSRYYIDFEDFEKKIQENSVRAFILCSPHNPVSRVWSEDELKQLLAICRKHCVAIISDEIHHDLVFGDSKHIPTLSLADENDRVIMFTAASKTFNIAAFQNSFAVIRNPQLRDEWDRFINGIRTGSGNPMGYIATETAYRYGKAWLEDVKETIFGNYQYIKDQFAKNLPDARLTPLEATYLAWADLGAYVKSEDLEDFIQKKCRLAFDYGTWFGGDKSSTFIRINLATSRENIEEMTRRIIQIYSISTVPGGLLVRS